MTRRCVLFPPVLARLRRSPPGLLRSRVHLIAYIRLRTPRSLRCLKKQMPLYDFIEAGRVASSASYLSFADGKQDGKVRVKYPNGDMYMGTYKQIGSSIRREGHGVYTWNTEDADDGEGGVPTQSRYEGQYARGLRHGIGTMTYTNGDVYRGRFVLNKRHGSGTLT